MFWWDYKIVAEGNREGLGGLEVTFTKDEWCPAPDFLKAVLGTLQGNWPTPVTLALCGSPVWVLCKLPVTSPTWAWGLSPSRAQWCIWETTTLRSVSICIVFLDNIAKTCASCRNNKVSLVILIPDGTIGPCIGLVFHYCEFLLSKNTSCDFWGNFFPVEEVFTFEFWKHFDISGTIYFRIQNNINVLYCCTLFIFLSHTLVQVYLP